MKVNAVLANVRVAALPRVENPHRLVTKEELLKAIWPNVVVTDQALTQCVGEVRQATGDDDQATIRVLYVFGL